MAKEKKFVTGITQRVDRVIDSKTATEEDMREWKKASEAVEQYQSQGGNIGNTRIWASRILLEDNEPITEQSRKWYAREALTLLHFIRISAAGGNATATNKALDFAVTLGALLKEFEMKFQWEPFALTGLKVHGGGSKDGYAVTPADALEALQWAESTYPDIGKTQQKKKAADKVGLGKSQFYAVLRKKKKK